jgi:hypothetical protein
VISPDKTSLPLIQSQMIAHKEAIAAALEAMLRCAILNFEWEDALRDFDKQIYP